MFSFHCAVPRVHSADYYMQEAKRLKHKADALVRRRLPQLYLQSLKNTGYTHTFAPQNDLKAHNVNIYSLECNYVCTSSDVCVIAHVCAQRVSKE